MEVPTVHLNGMPQRRETCKQCGKPLRVTSGRGRPRVYCSPACRNVAYERRRDAGPAPLSTVPPATGTAPDRPKGRREPMTMDELMRLIKLSAARDDAQMIVDRLLDSPEATHALMNEFTMRLATGQVLEDMRYQPAVNSLVAAYGMIGRLTGGDFTLPAVAT